MFDFFRRKTVKDFADDVTETYGLPEPVTTSPMPEVVAPKAPDLDNSTAEYTVGINKAGNTQLRIQLEYGSATLTMSRGAVLTLIRQLNATLEDETDEASNDVE
jgi:hypothetical protein